MKTYFKKYIIVIGGAIAISFTAKAQNILIDSIPFRYYQNSILFDAVINDTLQMTVFFDTGAYGLHAADSLNVYDGSENPKYIRVGKIFKEDYDFPKGKIDFIAKQNPMFRFLGVGAVLGWDFFDGKIIEISYKNNYIKVFDHMDAPAGYKKLDMSKEGNTWGVPGIIVVQGKRIEEPVMIDTGNAGTLTFNMYIKDKYNIDLTQSQQGASNTAGGPSQRSIVTCDTIRVGDSFMIDQRIAFRDVSRRSPLQEY